MNDAFWTLPGPQRFAAEIAHKACRGQHVTAVIPRDLLSDERFAVGLAAAIAERVHSAGRDLRRASDSGTGLTLIEELGRVFTSDEPPVTVPDLLDLVEAAGETAVFCSAEVSPEQAIQISELLRRLDVESRTRRPECRPTVVAIVRRDQLPVFQGGATSDVTVANVWWWDRLSRWDIAAYLSESDARSGHFAQSGVLADVRTETIIELARWEFDLVEHLAVTWSGDHRDLPDLVRGVRHDARALSPVDTYACGPYPEASVVPFWDSCELDGWHGSWSSSAASIACDQAGLQRRVWAAQARVLLPWIEEQRVRVERDATSCLTAGRLNAFLGRSKDDDVLEIGPLCRAINMLLGSSEPQLREAARRLRDARNDLAHLQPVRQGRLVELVRSCASLSH